MDKFMSHFIFMGESVRLNFILLSLIKVGKLLKLVYLITVVSRPGCVLLQDNLFDDIGPIGLAMCYYKIVLATSRDTLLRNIMEARVGHKRAREYN